MQKDLNKFLWVLFWGAIGDALWAPVEVLARGEFPWVDEYLSNPEHDLYEGERTDDTAMTLLLAESLIKKNRFDIEDQLTNYLKRSLSGYMGLRDYPQGMGNQTLKMLQAFLKYRQAKERWEEHHKPWEVDLSGCELDGNGSLMRIWSIPLFYFDDVEKAIFYAGESSKSTHNTDICIAACRYYVGLIWAILHGASKKEVLNSAFSPLNWCWEKYKIPKALQAIFEGSYKEKTAEELQTFWYVANSLEIALWWFYNAEDFKSGMEMVVNLGGDSDTNACIYGFLAGAYYGYESFPEAWKQGLVEKEKIIDFAEQLYILK